MLTTLRKQPTLRVLMFLLLSLLLAVPAIAGSIWTGAASTDWSDASNWNGGVPAIGDTLFFDSSSAANLNTSNDMAGLTNLSFDIDKSGVTISGNAIGLGSAGITADSLGSPILNVDLSQPGDTTYTVGSSRTITLNGVVSGAGGVVKAGGGDLVLNGVNTYTGGTQLNAGTVVVGSDSNLGDTSGGLTFNGGTLQTIGDITTYRSVTIGAGSGTFDTAGNNLNSWGTMTGTGSFAKSGTGTLILSGASTFSGLTSVNAGSLAVNGSLAGPVTVGAAGTLGGGGTVGNVTVSGSLAPGNSIGTINTGSLAFNAGSVYEVEVDAAGNSDRTNVTGTVSLGNATLSVLAQNGTYGPQTDYLIIDNDGADAVTGTFGTLTSNLAFLDPTVDYTGGDGNDVMLSLTRNNVNFSEVALTPNQEAVATALENATPNASGDMAAVINAITGLSTSQACAAYDQMGGAGLGAFYESDLSAATRYMKTVSDRLSTLLAAADPDMSRWDAGPLLASADALSATDAGPLRFGLGNAGPLTPEADWGVWGRGIGAWGNRSGKDVAEQYDYRITGVAIGVDRRLTDNVVAGLSIGHTDSDLNYDTLDDSGTAHGWNTALYAAWMQGPWYVDTVAAYARNNYDTKRHISFNGIDRIASGDFDGDVYSAYLEGGYTCDFKGLILQPLGSFQLVHMAYDAYTETGADALNLMMEDREETSVLGSLGMRLAKVIKNAGGSMVIPEAQVRWAHEFNHNNRTISATFAGTPAGVDGFRVEGDEAVRNRLIVGTGVTALFSERISAYLNYDAGIGENAFDHACSAGLRVTW